MAGLQNGQSVAESTRGEIANVAVELSEAERCKLRDALAQTVLAPVAAPAAAASAPVAELHLEVQTLGGSLIADVEVPPTTSILEVKRLIEAQGGPPMAQHTLVHDATLLNDDKQSVSSYNLTSGTVLNMILVAAEVQIADAGNEELNGYYKRQGTIHPTTGQDTGSPVYVKGEGDAMIWIHYYSGAKAWYINGNPSGNLYWFSYEGMPICPSQGWIRQEVGWTPAIAKDPAPIVQVNDVLDGTTDLETSAE